MRYCQICGKKDINNEFIHIFLDGDTSNNHTNNLLVSCKYCAHSYKLKRMVDATKILQNMGLRFNKKGKWTYNDKVVRADMVDIKSLNHKIEYLQKENKELKHMLGFKKKHSFL